MTNILYSYFIKLTIYLLRNPLLMNIIVLLCTLYIYVSFYSLVFAEELVAMAPKPFETITHVDFHNKKLVLFPEDLKQLLTMFNKSKTSDEFLKQYLNYLQNTAPYVTLSTEDRILLLKKIFSQLSEHISYEDKTKFDEYYFNLIMKHQIAYWTLIAVLLAIGIAFSIVLPVVNS